MYDDDYPDPEMVECPRCGDEYPDYSAEGRCVYNEGVCSHCYYKSES